MQHICEINNRTIGLAASYTAETPHTAYFDNPYRGEYDPILLYFDYLLKMKAATKSCPR